MCVWDDEEHNVRNEVDKHGGHFDNTHFLTGDGGFLQAIINGYGGLRILEMGLKMYRPSLPKGVKKFTFRGFLFMDSTFSYCIKKDHAVIEVKQNQGVDLCLMNGDGKLEQNLAVGKPVIVGYQDFKFPGTIRLCQSDLT